MTVETVAIIIPRMFATQNIQIRLGDLEAELTQVTTRTAEEEIEALLEAIDAA